MRRFRWLEAATALLGLTIVMALAFPPPALALGTGCTDRHIIVTRLADRWGEARKIAALGQHGELFEVFASDETGTWTMTVTQPGGVTCLMVWGGDFEAVSEPLPEPGEDM